MNSLQFKAEIDQYIDSSYKAFLEYQEFIKELFKVFHEVCEENKIHYYCAFGTLLGIVRDGGMIPWDADIDVMIPIDEAERYIKLLEDKLPENYYLISNYIDPNYYLCESRLCKKGYDPDIYHIDIFYLIGAPDDENQRIKFRKIIRKVFYIRAIRNQPIKRGDNRSEHLVYLAKKIIKFWLKIIPNAAFNKICNKLMHKYDISKCNYLTSWDDLAAIYPADAFEPVQKITIDNQEYYIPNDANSILEAIYSDYNSYMPISRRYDEFYIWLKRIGKNTASFVDHYGYRN